MSVYGSVSISRTRGENRFYNPPPIRQRQRQQQQRQKLEQEKHQKQSLESDDCATSYSSRSGRAVVSDATNLDRFLEYTTPVVPAQYFPKTSVRGWGPHEPELQPYFVLGDLWESFKEWSVYGAGVPLLLNGSDSVIQYFVPYLSAIQLNSGDESDAESSRETSSDGSSDYVTERGLNSVPDSALSWQNVADVNGHSWNGALPRSKSFDGSSSDERGEVCNPPGQLIFQYMEHDQPIGREPLADKISVLASQFLELRTYRSCDLSPSSWISVAWYPIYRIPTGPTLKSLDACFLTFHSLSTPIKVVHEV